MENARYSTEDEMVKLKESGFQSTHENEAGGKSSDGLVESGWNSKEDFEEY